MGSEKKRAPGPAKRPRTEGGGYEKNWEPDPAVSSRCAVVRFIRMQDVELTRQADVARAAVVKHLHAGCRNTDRVGVVPMRLECACGEGHLGAFDPLRARSEPDRVRPPAAGS